MAQPTDPHATKPAEETDIAPQQPERPLEELQAPAEVPALLRQAMGAQRIDLGVLLADASVVERISDAAEATSLGLEARGGGKYELAEKLYLHSMRLDDGAANCAANFANLADIARLRGDFQAAHDLTKDGLRRVKDYAKGHGIDLSTDGVGSDADPKTAAELKAFWFALAKVLNFKALTFRAEFDASGVGDERESVALESSLQLNQRSFDIATNIGHGGYSKKVLVDLLADKTESDDPAEWQSAIDTVTPLLEAGGLDANREQNFRCICGIAQMRLGENDEAIASFHTAYEVSFRAGLRRETANNLVRLAAALIETYGVRGTADSDVFDQLEACMDDLTESDIGSQQAALRQINELYPLPTRFIRIAEETA